MTSHTISAQQTTSDNLTTLQSYILANEAKFKGATGDFTWILSAIMLAGKAIAHKVRHARIAEVLGEMGSRNVHDEDQQKLDVIANEIIMRCLGNRANIGVLASEEGEEPTILRSRAEGGRYCVLFDPLDGSSNIDVGVGVGTIFTVLRNDGDGESGEAAILQPGTRQVAAGYILYGSSVVFVLTTGDGVDMFELDLNLGAFVLVKERIRMPETKAIYSVNEAYCRSFPDGYRAYLEWAHGQGYSSRYIGSMVADVHRTLLKGGLFMYPPTGEHRQGKLRLMYEANPMALVMEQAGGLAYADTQRILDIQPKGIHDRCSVIMGSKGEVERVLEFLGSREA